MVDHDCDIEYEGVAEGHLAMHSERQGEDVEGVVEGHLAIDSER